VTAPNLAEKERSSNRPTHESELHSLPSPVRVHEHQPLAETREHAAADDGDALVTFEHQRAEEIRLQLTTVAVPPPAGDASPNTAGGEADCLAVVPVASGASRNSVTLTHENDPRARPNIARNSRHPPTREVCEPNYPIWSTRDAARRARGPERERASGERRVRNTRHKLILRGRELVLAVRKRWRR
jgi:hypothetical protein